ncbi:MAG: hypothetical protein H0U74_12495 [Bradymonadaceae bacterium]|nr:hypothetical protein [Lujinxingiaceae bacterium]
MAKIIVSLPARIVYFFSILMVLGVLSGCADDPVQDARCVPGQSSSCACPGGELNVQVCQESGRFAPCQCPSELSDTGEQDANLDGRNGCGGVGALTLEGAAGAPGDKCGPCDDGLVVCAGPQTLRCTRASELNSCGGCEVLEAAPGDNCGSCGNGAFVCEGANALSCANDKPNACGGCTDLGEDERLFTCQVGSATGVLHCQTRNNLVCVGPGTNACGGAVQLTALPGVACGACGEGSYRCAGADEVVCDDQLVNACGGCAPLLAAPGQPCGDCAGSFQCDGTERVVCQDGTNACGGCSPLEHALGTSCGAGQHFVCNSQGGSVCKPRTDNLCGGTGILANLPNSACGPCGDGKYVCIAPNQTECANATQLNECGGCNRLNHKSGTACGVCATGRRVCADANTLACNGDANVQTDDTNCGVCGLVCAQDTRCEAGLCVGEVVTPPTPAGQTIVAGSQHSCALRAGGRVWCWGNNFHGQVNAAAGNSVNFHAPYETALLDVVQISARGNHTCARKQGGEVVCWGHGGHNRLGHGVNTANPNLVAVAGISDAIDVSAGDEHSCAVLAGGQIKCWGNNAGGQLGTGTTAVVAATATVVGIINARTVSAGANHTCAMLADKTARCWGQNAQGQLGNGTVAPNPEPAQISQLGLILQIEAGDQFSCALREHRQLVCWGNNSQGQLGNGSTSRILLVGSAGTMLKVLRFDLGRAHSCAVQDDGAAFCWGSGANGQLGDGSYQGWNSTDGGVIRTTPTQVQNISSVSEISAGAYHSCAKRSSGQLFCWGQNFDGRLGDNQRQSESPVDRRYAVAIPTLSPVTSEAGLCSDGIDNDADSKTDCDDGDCATDLGMALGQNVGDGNTCLYGNYFASQCHSNIGGTQYNNGAEKLFTWRAPSAGTYSFDLKGSARYGMLYAFNGGCTGVELACVDTTYNSNQVLSLPLTSGQRITIVVDTPPYYDVAGSGGGCGLFQLNIEKTAQE